MDENYQSGNSFIKNELKRTELKINRRLDLLEGRVNSIYFGEDVRAEGPTLKFRVQSDDVTVPDITATHSEEGVIEFVDVDVGDKDGFMGHVDEVVEDIYTGKNGLDDFLSRPVRIASYAIPLNETFTQRSLSPWNLFFNNATIKRKLDNYAWIQCDLNIKIVVNSTPFVYGAYMMAYRPHVNFAKHQDLTANYEPNLVPISQRMNVVIESHKNKGGELLLPFFWYKNWLNLTSASELTEMGQLSLMPYTPFQSANGVVTTPVSVNVYAWATNVKLAGNTVSLAVQSSDEYGQGPVSSIASAVANFSTGLESVPIIGRFARATTIGAQAVGSIASIFGFTNVPVISDVMPFKNLPFHAFASSEIGVPIDKLALDPKNELTVDPTTAGLSNVDELALVNLMTRESFLVKVPWTPALLEDYLLFNCNVSPALSVTITDPVQPLATRDFDTPMSYFSRLFTNWRGDVVIRIHVVRSKFHQGRLRVTYDPVGDINTNADTETTCITKIIDLQDSDFVEFTIPYMQPQSWLRLRPNRQDDFAISATPVGSYSSKYHNGRFNVRVLNPLTGPTDTSPVELLFFVRAAPSLELANPSDVEYESSTFDVQSADELVEYVMGKTTAPPDHRYDVNFGERIPSIRALMRRTCYHSSYSSMFITSADTLTSIFVSRRLYPSAPGYDSTGLSALGKIVSGTTAGNAVRETPYTWVSGAFVGQRGSMNYSVNHTGDEFTTWNVTRDNEPAISTNVTNTFSFSASNYFASKSRQATGITGMSLINERSQNGFQFSVPFMNRFRFADASPINRNDGVAYDDSDSNGFAIVGTRLQIPTTPSDAMDFYHSIGTDYSCMWFLNVPVRWSYDITVP